MKYDPDVGMPSALSGFVALLKAGVIPFLKKDSGLI
jgi:hypothetical protein